MNGPGMPPPAASPGETRCWAFGGPPPPRSTAPSPASGSAPARPLPADELDASPGECGPTAVRVVEGVPEGSRTWRAVQLLAATAAERLWITDAYLVAPAALYAALIDAARDGVDVRILLPGATDIPTVRALTRIGYRDLLAAGVRIFEWRGPMLHAKTLVVDRRWVRVGSTNLNFSSLLANYELDVVVDDEALAVELAERFRLDAADSREIVLRDGRRLLLPRLVDAAVPAPHPTSAPRSS